jgi:hypothetical protein
MSWMANKFQSAMPGALLGTDHIMAFLLHHFDLLYVSLIIFSAGELIAGVFLVARVPDAGGRVGLDRVPPSAKHDRERVRL